MLIPPQAIESTYGIEHLEITGSGMIIDAVSNDPQVVINGHERVLRARLADARFFYSEDQKKTLPAMAEDLIMEFEECPEDPVPQLEKLRLAVNDIEDALVPLMTGLVQVTGLMQITRRIPIILENR